MNYYKRQNKKKLVIHTYNNININNRDCLPPGFADFLRGTICLYNLCQLHSYSLFLYYLSHPIFSFFEYDPTIYIKDIDMIPYVNRQIYEVLPCHYLNYDDQDLMLKQLFLNNQSFFVLTNNFYFRDSFGQLINYGPISMDCKTFMKKILKPTQSTLHSLNHIKQKLDIIDNEYIVIHIRYGDNHLIDKNFSNNDEFKKNISVLITKINQIINLSNNNVVLVTDSDLVGNTIKQQIPNLKYLPNNKVHIGITNNIDELRDSIIDFLLLTKANYIYNIAFDRLNTSYNQTGFSQICSTIFDIRLDKLL